MQREFLIDTDTASDDAVALSMALRDPLVRVLSITVVSGNVPVQQGTRNALYTLELCAADVPVYVGADRPLVRAPADARWFHGKDGLGDIGYPAPRRAPESLHAVDAMIQTIRSNPGITIVTLGPLTNLALALQHDPAIVQHVARCVVMGGNPCCEGNVTPAAEFNIWCDPEAAQIVLRSGLPLEMVGWQLSRGEAVLSRSDIEQVRSLKTQLADFCIDCNRVAMEAYRRQTGEAGIALPDPVAMAVALDPSVCTQSSQHHVQIGADSDLVRGMTIVDKLDVASDERNREAWRDSLTAPKTNVCWEIDVRKWKRMLIDAVSGRASLPASRGSAGGSDSR